MRKIIPTKWRRFWPFNRRKNNEILKTNFSMYDRKLELRKQGEEFMTCSNSNHEFNQSPKVFGTRKEVKDAEKIGDEVVFKNPAQETHWHIDRRKKEETIERKKKR